MCCHPAFAVPFVEHRQSRFSLSLKGPSITENAGSSARCKESQTRERGAGAATQEHGGLLSQRPSSFLLKPKVLVGIGRKKFYLYSIILQAFGTLQPCPFIFLAFGVLGPCPFIFWPLGVRISPRCHLGQWGRIPSVPCLQ